MKGKRTWEETDSEKTAFLKKVQERMWEEDLAPRFDGKNYPVHSQPACADTSQHANDEEGDPGPPPVIDEATVRAIVDKMRMDGQLSQEAEDHLDTIDAKTRNVKAGMAKAKPGPAVVPPDSTAHAAPLTGRRTGRQDYDGMLNALGSDVDEMQVMYSLKAGLIRREEGNALLRKGKYKEAHETYQMALEAAIPVYDDMPVLITQNLAAAYLKLGQPGPALIHSWCACNLPRMTCEDKAAWRVAKSAEALGFPVAALYALEKYMPDDASGAVAAELPAYKLKLEKNAKLTGHQTAHQNMEPRVIDGVVYAGGAVGEFAFGEAMAMAMKSCALPFEHPGADCIAPVTIERDFVAVKARVAKLKEQGNQMFKNGDTVGAIAAWRATLPAFDRLAAVVNNQVVAVHMNRSPVLVLLTMGQLLSLRQQEDLSKVFDKLAWACGQCGWLEIALHFGEQGMKQ